MRGEGEQLLRPYAGDADQLVISGKGQHGTALARVELDPLYLYAAPIAVVAAAQTGDAVILGSLDVAGDEGAHHVFADNHSPIIRHRRATCATTTYSGHTIPIHDQLLHRERFA